jgi:hypothetical protein
MKNGVSDRQMVREYLLGRLDDREEIESKVSDDIFFSDDISEMVDSIEDEIIEEYVEGTLDSGERKAVEEYFLRSPERREKLRFFRILRSYLETKPDRVVEPQTEVLPVSGQGTGRDRVAGKSSLWGSRIFAYGQLAALILLSILGLSYMSGAGKKRALLESDLARERQHSASLAAEVSQLQTPMILLTLAEDRSREAGARVPRIEIRPSTERIVVEIALTNPRTASYAVQLETRGGNEPVWAARLLPFVSPSGDARLRFDLPAQSLESGGYSLLVSSNPSTSGSRKYYDFEVRVTK